jgi:hypothetical protein
MQALISIVMGLMPAAKIAGLSLSQWVAIINAVEAAAPEVQAALKDLEPVFADILTELSQGLSHQAIAQNRASEIPGYASDGSVVGIKQ